MAALQEMAAPSTPPTRKTREQHYADQQEVIETTIREIYLREAEWLSAGREMYRMLMNDPRQRAEFDRLQAIADAEAAAEKALQDALEITRRDSWAAERIRWAAEKKAFYERLAAPPEYTESELEDMIQ